MIGQIVAVVAVLLFKLADNLFTSDEEQDKAKRQLPNRQQEGKLKAVEQQISLVTSDSQSKDPWTSRARPSFLYVFYILLLWAIPTGILSICNA